MIGLRYFPLKSADVSGAGTRDEPLGTSAWEARHYTEIKGSIRKGYLDFRRQVYQRVGNSRVEVYGRVGKSIIKVLKTAFN